MGTNFSWESLVLDIMHCDKNYLKVQLRDFPDGPVIKTSPSNTRSVGSIPGWEAKTPYPSGPKIK